MSQCSPDNGSIISPRVLLRPQIWDRRALLWLFTLWWPPQALACDRAPGQTHLSPLRPAVWQPSAEGG